MTLQEIRAAVALETRRLIDSGVPELLAGMQASRLVQTRVEQALAARSDALASSCNEA